MPSALTTGYTSVNGVDMYWESRGAGGVPLIVTHGGFGLTGMFSDLLDQLAGNRQVIAIELQGHGRTRDTGRPFRYESFGDDIAVLIDNLGLEQADLLGYSLGGSASLRCTIQHPRSVRRLAAVSIPYRRDGWFPEVLAGMDQMSSAGFDQLSQTPLYPQYTAVAPDPDAFPALMDKTGDLVRQPYDWSEEIKKIANPTLLVYGDADGIPPAHAAEFFALLGGGRADGGWDGSLPTGMRLAILPGLTHYNIFSSPLLAAVVENFIE